MSVLHVAIASLLVVSGAQAQTVAPGGNAVPQGVTLDARPGLAGIVVEDDVVPFSFPATIVHWGSPLPPSSGDVTGQVHTRVVRANDGTYDFYWQIHVDDTAFAAGVTSLHLPGIPAGIYSVGFRLDESGEVPPANAVQAHGGGLTFTFGRYQPPSDRLHPGDTSRFFFLDTHATQYAPASLWLDTENDLPGSGQISGNSVLYRTFAPIPEPAALVMMMLGLGALAVIRRHGRESEGGLQSG